VPSTKAPSSWTRALARQRQRESQAGGFSAIACVGGTLVVTGATISAAVAAAALVVVTLVLTQRHHHITKAMPSWTNRVHVAAVALAAPVVVNQGGSFEQI